MTHPTTPTVKQEDVTAPDVYIAEQWARDWKNCVGEMTALYEAFARHREAAEASALAKQGQDQGGQEQEDGRIMLRMAQASDEQEMWERRWSALCRTYPIERIFADRNGNWGLRDFLAYAGQICGFAPNPSATPQSDTWGSPDDLSDRTTDK